MEKIDKETSEVLQTGEDTLGFVKSEHWGYIKRKLTDKVVDLQWIGSVEGKTADEKALDMEARQKAVSILFEFLNEVEGEAEQHANNSENLLNDYKDDLYIRS